MKADSERNVELLVVGAGPVGLVGGLAAARAGLKVEIVDQTFRGWGRGHATLLHPRSLALLGELGLGAELLEAGHQLTRIAVRADGKEPTFLELPAPALAISQGKLEEVLLRALRAEDVEFVAPCQATTIQQNADDVSVRLVRRELSRLGSPAHYSEWEPIESFTVHADFVIGADGYESRVRSALGLEAVTLGSTESYAMFELGQAPPEHLEIAFVSGLASAIVPLPGQRTRYGFQIDSGLDAEADAGRLSELLRERSPGLSGTVPEVEWSSVIHFERRLSQSFGAGRVWLAGDSAHVTGPLGAHSMNIGIAEAYDLVRRVAACIAGSAPLESLERYGAERQREWHKLLGYHVKFELLPHAPRWLAEYARRIVPTLPASGPDLKNLLEQLGLRIA